MRQFAISKPGDGQAGAGAHIVPHAGGNGAVATKKIPERGDGWAGAGTHLVPHTGGVPAADTNTGVVVNGCAQRRSSDEMLVGHVHRSFEGGG